MAEEDKVATVPAADLDALNKVVEAARGTVEWSSKNYAIDPKYWIAVPVEKLEALISALATIDDKREN